MPTRKKTVRTGRIVHIFNERGQLAHTAEAKTLKEALLNYAAEQPTLNEPSITGNVMSAVTPGGFLKHYTAKYA